MDKMSLSMLPIIASLSIFLYSPFLSLFSICSCSLKWRGHADLSSGKSSASLHSHMIVQFPNLILVYVLSHLEDSKFLETFKT